MIVLLAAVVLLLAVGAAVVLAATGLAGRRDREGLGLPLVPVVVGGVVVVVLLLVVATTGLGGARSTLGDGPELEHDPEAAVEEEGERTALRGEAASFDAFVTVDGRGPGLRPLPSVAGLEPGDVISVTGVGFVADADGVVAQCESVDSTVCRNLLPIRTDGDGRLEVPYRLEDGDRGDVLVAEVDLDRGVARLTFGPAVPAAALWPAGDGTLRLRGVEAGRRVSVLRCPRGASALDACEAVGRVVAAADGTASFGVEGRRDSTVVVVGPAGDVVAEPVDLVVTEDGPSARVDVDLPPAQLLTGFGTALALLAIGVVLVRRTDWRAPAEAATPELDAAASVT